MSVVCFLSDVLKFLSETSSGFSDCLVPGFPEFSFSPRKAGILLKAIIMSIATLPNFYLVSVVV